MTSPDLQAAQAAFERGYADSRERQDFYLSRPGEGVRWPSDDPSWHSPYPSDLPKGLGYLTPPEPIPVYSGAEPGLVPQVLPVPVPDGDLPAPLTGSVRGGWRALRSDARPPVIVARTGRPRRRNLLSKVLGR
jgi:hypothetical protein